MAAKDLIEICGTVDDVIFYNDENGYTVLRLETDSGENIVATGCLPFAASGEKMILAGTWVRHPNHGAQFQAEYAQRIMPRGAEAIFEYLSSRVIKGIGPATASALVSAFGAETLEVIEHEPERLVGLKGISEKKAQEMCESLRKQMSLRRLMEFLNGYELKPQYAMRLYAFYGSESLEVVRANPYIISMPHIGAAFSEADMLALNLGMEGDSIQRIAAAIIFELRHNSGNGHVFIPRDKLIAATSQLIDIDINLVAEGLEQLIESGDVICSTVANVEGCYLEDLYDAEHYTAVRLKQMAYSDSFSSCEIEAIIEKVQKQMNITYAPMQLHTLSVAAKNAVMVLTGGPGTGKTTTVKAIIAMFEEMGLKVMLTAPTGRAAKRMTELTGREAATIHRLLEAGFAGDDFEIVFKRDESEPLKCDVVILDECSMVDITLMRALLAALPKDARLVIVGDAEQLPSVGPGNVLLDIIRSAKIPTVRLVEIFRQTSESRIVTNAHLINAGDHPNLAENKGDFFFMRRLNQDAALDTVLQLCSRRLPDNMGMKVDDIQVLTPTRKGVCGTVSLNKYLQGVLNPASDTKKEKKFGEITFREGDRVMQIRNNYDIVWFTPDKKVAGTGIYNGDIGYIEEIDYVQESVSINFDGHVAAYGFDMLSELEHAWAMTVHKAQGSEYRCVVLCVCGGPPQLLHRGVLYTAVTRARELLVIVGDDGCINQMIDNYKQTRRYSGLRARLCDE